VRLLRGGAWPALRAVFVTVNLAILAVPLGGVFFLRLYESVLIRRAEAELVAQGTVIAAAFRHALAHELAAGADPAGYGRPAALPFVPAEEPAPGSFAPRVASLDLTIDLVLPETPEVVAPPAPADRFAVCAGDELAPLLLEVQRVTLAGIRVTDFRGTVVATTGKDLGRSLRNRGEVLGALTGESVSCIRERVSDGPPLRLGSLSRTAAVRVHVTVPVVAGRRVWGAVVLVRTPMGVAQSLYGIRGYILAAGAVLLLVITCVSLFISFAVSRPIRALVDRAERVARGERGVAVALERPGTAEIHLLSRAVEAMTRTLERRADTIRAFASSVSHEFKTPLAAMKGAVELLADHGDGMTPPERGRFLANLEQDVTRLDRLVRGLVDLARADVVAPGGSAEVAAALAEVAARFGAEVEVPAADPGRARIGAPALAAVLGNLVDNARRHGGPEVAVRLRAMANARAGREGVAIEVADDGRGIPEADQGRVFEPFFTTAQERGGSGLGLAVVRSLVEAHGGSIALRSRPGETVFTVWLPRA
jgi:signal transduction histidine kinase